MKTDINIFISHCHQNQEDQQFLDDLLMFIKPAINNLNDVKLWSDRKLLTGQHIDNAIETALTDMNLMVCLVSPEYLNSNYCIQKELKDALDKRQIGKANIFPIILRKCVWKHTFFGQILCQPKDGKPLKEWHDKDQILSDITDALMDVIKELQSQQETLKKKQSQPPLITKAISQKSKKLADHLNNLGIHIKHANKDFLKLEEIFVYPDIRVIDDISTIQKQTWTPQEVLNEYKLTYFRGTEEIGKTSLCKKLAQDYLNKNKKIIYLNGIDIRSSDINVLIQEYRDKYEVSDIESLDNITLFIDDFEKQRLKPQHLDKLLKVISENFNEVVIFIDKKSLMHNRINYVKHGFKEVEILPFGYKKRHELIKKWVLLESDNDENIITSDTYSRIDLFARNFDSIMKKNIMDSRPIYIISIIQTLENLSYTNGNYSLTSYGQCYHVLITGMLSKSKVSIQDLDGVLNFLSYLAYTFYKSKIDHISTEDFEKIVMEYSKKFVPPNDILNILLNSGVLATPDNDSLRFSQKYLYYFSCAKHLSDNFKILTLDITHLCENIHNEKNANILIFLVHHLRGTDLLDEILTHAICLLDNINVFDMSLPTIQQYKKIIGEQLTKIALDDTKSVEEQRIHILEKQDQLEDEIGELTPVEYALQDNNINSRTFDQSDEFNLLQQAISALKSIDVLGQIVKNRHSSIEIAELKNILSSTYDISLKVLNFYLSIFNENESELEELLLNVILDSKQDYTENEAKEIAKTLIHNFIFGLCFYMIQLVSKSTAHNKLIDISNQICGEDETSPAYRLINLYSQLLVSPKLPKSLIRQIKKENPSNVLVISLLSSIVANHAYLHNLDYQDKQWIQDQLGIAVSKQIKSNSSTLLPMPN